jgi:hypothetical protein
MITSGNILNMNHWSGTTGFLLLATALALSCGQPDPRHPGPDSINFDSRNIVIHLDNFTPFEYNCTRIYQGIDRNAFVITNFQYGSVDFYDIADGSFKRRIKLTDPSIGLNRLAGICELDNGRFLAINAFKPEHSIILDTNGLVLDHKPVRLSRVPFKTILNVHAGNSTVAAITRDGELLFTCFHLFNAGDIRSVDHNFVFVYKYNFESDSLIPVPVYYPHQYRGKELPSLLSVPSTVYNRRNDLLVISWPAVSEILVVKPSTLEHFWIEPEGNQVDCDLSKINYTQDKMGEMQSLIINAFYLVLYDEKNDIYYRIYTKPIKDAFKTGDILTYLRQEIGIQLIDNDFSVIGEISLPADTYDIFRSFVYEGDLYLSGSNIFNERFREDELLYERISPHLADL